MFSFLKPKKVIGIDIGSSSIKVVEMDVGGNSATLQSFGFAPTPPDIVSAGEIRDTTAVATIVRSLLNETKSRRKFVSTCLSGSAVIVRKMTIPKLEKKFIREHVRFEAEANLPFDINQVSLTHHLLNLQQSPDSMEVLVIAAQNALIDQYKDLANIIGVPLGVLDISGFALANSFEFNYGKLPGVVGLFNFGASMTNVVVLYNGETVFCRDVPFGGNLYTNEIHRNLGVTIPEAEALKLAAMSGREEAEPVQSVISATNEQFNEELRNQIDVIKASTNGLTLSRCFYTGGASQTPGLVESATKVIGAPMEAMNPLLKVKANVKRFPRDYLNQVSPFISLVVGLGLRQIGDSP
ncbi:MAG: type IV pilus assembly protein PilM [Pseudobdellovibrionaceae bacterium]